MFNQCMVNQLLDTHLARPRGRSRCHAQGDRCGEGSRRRRRGRGLSAGRAGRAGLGSVVRIAAVAAVLAICSIVAIVDDTIASLQAENSLQGAPEPLERVAQRMIMVRLGRCLGSRRGDGHGLRQEDAEQVVGWTHLGGFWTVDNYRQSVDINRHLLGIKTRNEGDPLRSGSPTTG